MKSGLEPCPKCGKIVRPARRAIPHDQTAECRIRLAHIAYNERGWRAVTATWASILDRAGVPVERAPGAVKTLVENTRDAEGLRTSITREVVTDAHWAPIAAAQACEALAKVRLSPALREFAVRMLFEHPEYIASLDAVRRLDGGRASFVLKLAREHGWTTKEVSHETETEDSV